jgi:carboxyl-terminal processing protease
MALWGLRGITAIDPALTVSQRDGKLRIAVQGKQVADAVAPATESAVAWANAAAALAVSAANLSPAVRKAGGVGVTQAFFDELFNHMDPYSRYVAPMAAADDRMRRAGRAGLGITLGREGSAIVARAVVRDGPGALLGIRPGDAIVSVDRQSTRGMEPRAVAALIDGPEDTRVAIAWRGRDGRTREAVATREAVPPETVSAERVDNVLVVRIAAFSRTTDAHLAQVLHEAFAGGRPVDGLVIDLRGNRGGLLRQAVSAADILLPPGIVAVTAGRAREANFVWRSTAEELGEDLPVVVVVDGRTASAAEVLAAALADRGRAVALGSATLGKGLVQTVAPLPDGGELYVSWSRILAPRGWPVQGLGLLPQVCTSRGFEQARRQIEALAQGRQVLAGDLAAHRKARAPLPPAQALAIRAACPAAEGRDSDIDAARLLIATPAAYEAALLPPMAAEAR